MTGELTQFPNLLSPIRINGLSLKNRIVSTGHGTRLADNHEVSDRMFAYHAARAQGGAGLIITEAAMVDADSVVSRTHLVAADDNIIPSLSRLADKLHHHDCALFGQLFHLGLEQPTGPDGTRAVALGPSASPSERYHTAGREMPHAKVREIVGKYGDAALRMKRAGLDGIEVAASHGYLVAQFLSPQINRREDEYGGSFENRMRFLNEIIDNVREKVGADIVVGIRISGDELTSDGLEADEVLAICESLSKGGAVDYFNITSGSSRQRAAAIHIVPPMSTDMALTVPFAAAIKERVSQPVMAVGRINHAPAAEQILATGQADLCGMTRALITDPEMPNKLRAGKIDSVRVCIACNQSCIDRMHRGFGVSCIQHPESGRELVYGVPKMAGQPKRVLVAGGGPGGMKAAAVAASRGHHVTLYEKSNRLGGQALLAQLLPRRSEFGGIVGNLEQDMTDAGVEVVLGQALDRAFIENQGPDVVLVATGANAHRPDIEGYDGANVFDPWQVLKGEANIGSKVVIADWRCDWIGLGLAEKLALDGCQVRLGSAGHVAGESIPQYMRDLWLGEMHRLGVELLPLVRLFGIDEDIVYFQHIASGEPVILEDVDTVVVAYGHESDTQLERELQAWDGEMHLVGDCAAPRTAEEAVLEGLEVATNI